VLVIFSLRRMMGEKVSKTVLRNVLTVFDRGKKGSLTAGGLYPARGQGGGREGRAEARAFARCKGESEKGILTL